MGTTVEEYVATMHACCDEHERNSRLCAQARLRKLERLQSAQAARPVARGLSRRSAIAAWDRLRAAGLIPIPRSLAAARPLPDITLPAWLTGLHEDELGLAWVASSDFPAAEPMRWIARARSIARSERTGRYGGDDARTTTVVRDGTTSYLAADGEILSDWLARDRDDQDAHAVALERLAILRRELGAKLTDCLASGMTHEEAAVVCGVDARTIRRRLHTVRKLVSSVF